jgi:hypothetical protein
MTMRITCLALGTLLAGATGAFALGPTAADLASPDIGFVVDGGDLEVKALAEGSCLDPALAEEPAPAEPPSLAASASAAASAPPDPQATPGARPVAFEYSDGYYKRLKVHKVASFATLPLFITQFALGQKLYSGDYGDGTKDAHTAVAIGTATLFGVNTVTGVMNLWEARKDPNKNTKKKVHGIMMLTASAGFVATGFLAPDDEGEGDRSAHRAVALTSMGIATVAYLIMLFGN